MSNITLYRQRAAEIKRELRLMLDKAAAENRDLNEVESGTYDRELKALEAVEQCIEHEQELLELNVSLNVNFQPTDRPSDFLSIPRIRSVDILRRQLGDVIR